MNQETVKDLLDYLLEDSGIDDNHQLYEVFDTVFRMGLTWGTGGLVRAYIEEKREVYIHEDGYIGGGTGVKLSDDDKLFLFETIFGERGYYILSEHIEIALHQLKDEGKRERLKVLLKLTREAGM